jgi:hypothetical protein
MDTGVRVAPGRRFSCRRRDGELAFHMTADDGHEEWAFDLATQGYEALHPNFYSFRPTGRYVYIVAAEPLAVEARGPGQHPSASPRSFHLLTLELEHGKVCQDIVIGDTALARCRIEDVDEQAVLLSTGETEMLNTLSGNVLHFFRRQVDEPK